MKNFKNSVIIYITINLLFYLIGSFYEVSFNISDWEEDTRGIIAGIGTFMGYVCILVYNVPIDDIVEFYN